jgi:ATP-dependent DNA helicase 2 subunit 1
LFYQDLINFDDDFDPYSAASKGLEEMQDKMASKLGKKRSLATLELNLGGDVNIGVKVYCMVKVTSKEAGITLSKKDNKPLKSLVMHHNEFGESLMQFEIKKYYPYGGEKVLFTDDEMKTVKTFGEPGLVLMGFKPQSALEIYHNIKSAYFLYPDEYSIQGSDVAFHALLLQMHKSKKIAICRLIVRKSGVPRFVALLPQIEVQDENKTQLKPPGLHMIFLPYADDIREIEEKSATGALTSGSNSSSADNEVTPEMINQAKLLIKGLTADEWTPDVFRNPSLQKFYAVLHALALDETADPNDYQDMLYPDADGMEQMAPIISKFVETFDHLSEGKSVSGSKRKITASSSSSSSSSSDSSSTSRGKKVKKEEVDANEHLGDNEGSSEFDTNSIKAMINSDTLKKLTIPQLKEICKGSGLSVGGKKDDLLQRISMQFS